MAVVKIYERYEYTDFLIVSSFLLLFVVIIVVVIMLADEINIHY